MTVGIMQPYFLPYIGYFQLISAVDKFVIYDNIEFTKKGWINRNRILVNGKDDYITLPLKKDSDFLNVNQRFLTESWNIDRIKILNRIKESYRKAAHFKEVFLLIEEIMLFNASNLFDFIFFSIQEVTKYLEINSSFIVSSSISIDHTLKSVQKVLAICKELKAEKYINPIGGTELYNKETFQNSSIDLRFIKTNPILYKQFSNEFVPWLSILDVMMFNSRDKVRAYLNDYSLV